MFVGREYALFFVIKKAGAVTAVSWLAVPFKNYPGNICFKALRTRIGSGFIFNISIILARPA